MVTKNIKVLLVGFLFGAIILPFLVTLGLGIPGLGYIRPLMAPGVTVSRQFQIERVVPVTICITVDGQELYFDDEALNMEQEEQKSLGTDESDYKCVRRETTNTKNIIIPPIAWIVTGLVNGVIYAVLLLFVVYIWRRSTSAKEKV